MPGQEAASDMRFLDELYAVILERRRTGAPESSYVARMAAKGTARLAQKVGEEAVETVIAAMQKDNEGLRYESADLVFHLMMLWAEAGIAPGDIVDELRKRHMK